MKENKYQADEELKLLLQKLILKETDHTNIQKSLTMSANYIFDRTPEFSMSIEREKELLQKLNKAFAPASANKRTWKIFLSGLIMLILGIYFWKAPKEKNVQVNPPESKIHVPVVSEQEEMEPQEEQQEKKRITASLPETPEISAENKDTIVIVENKSVAKNNGNGRNSSGNSFFMFPEYAAGKELHPAPVPVFTAKPSPENFNPVKAFFAIDSLHKNDYSYFIVPEGFTATYYKGEPFRKGSLPDMQYINYGEYVQELQNDKWRLPASVLFYADPDNLKVSESANGLRKKHLVLDKIPDAGAELAVSPFYFRKFEVTNKEYREFIKWVQISNGYEDKKIQEIAVDTVPVNDPNDTWGQQVTLKGNRFRIIHTTTRLEDFQKVFSYTFFKKDHQFLLNSSNVFVLPDTTCWITDFPYSFNQPMTDMYFSHPAYDDYPVVGVSWYQAMAYLDWKTRMHQEQLDAQKIPIEVFYSLPSEIHWELVSMTAIRDKKLIFQASLQDINWVSDLGVEHSNQNQEDERNQRTSYLKNLFTKDQYAKGNFITDGFFHTGPSDLTKQKLENKQREALLLGPLDISWLGGNVSEWMQGTYRENWQTFFELHQKTFPEENASLQLAAKIEAFFNETNAQNGCLVKGANWYDERFGQKAGSEKNDAGMSPRRFLDPSAQHSTVGFRYVMQVRWKDL